MTDLDSQSAAARALPRPFGESTVPVRGCFGFGALGAGVVSMILPEADIGDVAIAD
jgi:hypothetical protein